VNDGLFVLTGASPQPFWVSGRLLPGGLRNAQAFHHPVFCKSRRSRLHSRSRVICLSFDV